jgi:hypothetical protein
MAWPFFVNLIGIDAFPHTVIDCSGLFTIIRDREQWRVTEADRPGNGALLPVENKEMGNGDLQALCDLLQRLE